MHLCLFLACFHLPNACYLCFQTGSPWSPSGPATHSVQQGALDLTQIQPPLLSHSSSLSARQGVRLLPPQQGVHSLLLSCWPGRGHCGSHQLSHGAAWEQTDPLFPFQHIPDPLCLLGPPTWRVQLSGSQNRWTSVWFPGGQAEPPAQKAGTCMDGANPAELIIKRGELMAQPEGLLGVTGFLKVMRLLAALSEPCLDPAVR